MDWKIFGLLVLLFSGAGALINNIAVLFGAGSGFTLVLVAICLVSSLVMAAAISRRLKGKYGGSLPPYDGRLPPQYNTQRMRALTYQGWSKEQRLRFFFAGMWSTAVFLVVDLVAYLATLALFPNTQPQIAILVEVSIAIAIAAMFGVTFYRKVRPRKISEK